MAGNLIFCGETAYIILYTVGGICTPLYGKCRRMHVKMFKRKKENFVCEKCGAVVKGNGYTNHCPRCLWSKHVDINPGDRMCLCRGLMEPVEVVKKGDSFRVLHRCIRCGFQRWNKASEHDKVVEFIISHGRTKKDI